MKKAVPGLVVLWLLISVIPVSAYFSGELGLSSEIKKTTEWEHDLSSALLLDYRENIAGLRLDAQLDAIMPGDEEYFELSLERLSVRHFAPPWTWTLGKQPISWGVGRSWPQKGSPLNYFSDNPWAITGRKATGTLGFWTVTAGLHQDEPVLAARKQDYLSGLRWSALALQAGEETLVGFDAQVDVGIELYGDALYWLRPDRGVQLLVGADYPLGPLVAVSEYRYDYLADQFGPGYLYQGISFHIDEFTPAYLGLDINLQDKSRLWSAGVSTVLTNDLSISLSAIYPRGDALSEYGLMEQYSSQTYLITVKLAF